MDNVFIERLWRSLKYGVGYLKAYPSVRDAEQNIDVLSTLTKQQAVIKVITPSAAISRKVLPSISSVAECAKLTIVVNVLQFSTIP